MNWSVDSKVICPVMNHNKPAWPEAAGLGPAAMWTTKIGGKDAFITFKWLHEYHAENRLAGNHFFPESYH